MGLAGQRAPGAGTRGPAVATPAAARTVGPQAVPGLGGVPPNSIWIYDTTHFTRAGVAATVVEDLVSRKWLAEIVSVEETATQLQVVFTDALEAEGCWRGSRPVWTAWSTPPWMTRPGRSC